MEAILFPRENGLTKFLPFTMPSYTEKKKKPSPLGGSRSNVEEISSPYLNCDILILTACTYRGSHTYFYKVFQSFGSR